MLEFFGSFFVIIILFILTLFGCIIFFIVKIIKYFADKKKREDSEQAVLNTADSLLYYMENKNITQIEELIKQINMPKHMKITEENNEVFIYYRNLKYNVNKGRFIINF